MKKLRLLMAFCALFLIGGGNFVSATDYLTNFGDYTVTKTAVSNDNTSGTAREFWRGGIIGFDVNGTSTIPNGVYSFSVQAVYRGHLEKDIPTGIIAYAESDGAQYMAPICNKTDGTVSSVSLDGFKTAFETPSNYLNTIPYIIVTDGKIKVGVKSMSTQPFCGNGMWFIFNTASFKVSDVTDAEVLATALSDTKAQAAGLLASNSDETTERSNLQSAYDAATATTADIVNLKQKIDAYLAKLVEIAELENPRDVSYYFTNPKYSIRNLDLVGGLVTSGNVGSLGQPFGWTCFDAGGAVDNGSGDKFQAGQGYNWFSTIGNTTAIDGHTANYDEEKTGGYSIYQRIAWNQWAEQTHSAKQTATLPAGKYKISVPAYASANSDDYKGYVIFTVNGTNDSRTVTASSWNVYEKEFILAEQTEVSVDMQFNKLRRAQNVGSAWAFFDGVTLLSYGDPVAALKKELSDLQATIDDDYLNNATYTNVIGTERTNLSAQKTATAAAETVEAYQTVINDVNAAINAFTGAKTNYDALVTEIAKAKALGIDDATADGYAATSSSTAATALTSTQNLKVAEYEYVTNNYPYPVELGSWTTSGSVGTASGQHWDGTNESTYYEQSFANWSSSSAWEIGYNQDVTLPAGDYVFKVAGRHGSQSTVCNTIELTVTNSSDVVLGTVADFPIGDTGKGIDTSGATNFGDGTYANSNNGRGWEWRYVKFSLASEETINIAVSASSDGSYNHQWIGFCNATLQADNDDVADILAYNIAKASAISARDDAQYVNVTGSERTALVNAINADPTSDYSAATTALDNARVAFTGAKTSYDTFVAAKAVEYVENLPYASSAKFAAIATAQGAANATSATDAEEKTNAILSAYRLYVESNALAEGIGGIDKTSLISDANMETTYDGTNHKFGAWEVIGQTNGTIQLLSDQSFTDGSGKNDYKYADIYKKDNNAGIQQTISLTPGKYILTVTARAQATADASFKLFAGTNDVEIPRVGNAGGTFNRGWNDVSLEFTVTETSDVNIGVQSGNGKDLWWSATHFRLAKIGDVVKLNGEGYATYSANYAVEVSGAEAYTAELDFTNSKITCTKIATNKVPAGNGVLLYGDANADVTLSITTDAAALGANNLKATTQADGTLATKGGNSYYALSGNTFKLFESDAFVHNKAYFEVEGKTVLARSMSIVFDGNITGVANVEAAAEAKAKDGKYLENGKIVIVKNGVKYNAAGAKLY